MTGSIAEELISKFGKSINEPELINSCEQIIKIFSITVEDLYINWESFVVTRYDAEKLEYTVENLIKLQNYIQEKLEKKRSSNITSTVKSNRKIINLQNNSSPFSIHPTTPSLLKRKQLKNNISDTPSRTPLAKSNENPAASTSPLIDRTPQVKLESSNVSINQTPTPLKSASDESGKILETLNAEIKQSPGFEPDIDQENPVKLTAGFDSKKYQFRTMRTKLLEAADVLDDQIDSFVEIFTKHYELSASDISNPSIISQSEIITVGRIVPDNPSVADNTILNADSLALESSRIIGIGRRVQLDLSNIANYSFFPGQIVGLKGKNASGDYFKVTEILETPLLGAPISSRDELERYYYKNKDDVKVLIVNGPYTSNRDLKFDKLSELVDKINTDIKPHSVIFIGPFIDITHPLIASGEFELSNDEIKVKPKTLAEVFKLAVSPILKKINNKVQCILIPSLRDAVSKHAAYPQDSFDRKELALTKNFKTFPNPSVFQINESLIGVSNNDIFKDLKDISKGENSQTNRFDRIANHIISQRRFYPVFPGSSKQRKRKLENGQEVVDHLPGSELDVPYLGLSEFGDVIPDILIIPSELRYFARIVKNVLIINPGPFMRAHGAGTYVVLAIKNPGEDFKDLENVENDNYLHNIWKRARVDIHKA